MTDLTRRQGNLLDWLAQSGDGRSLLEIKSTGFSTRTLEVLVVARLVVRDAISQRYRLTGLGREHLPDKKHLCVDCGGLFSESAYTAHRHQCRLERP